MSVIQSSTLTVWRLTINPGAEPGCDPRQFCLEKGLLGIGYAVSGANDLTWDEYCGAAQVEYSADRALWSSSVNRIKADMVEGDLCWTRDHQGVYYLGQVTGPWRYDASPQHRQADLVNVRPCSWLRVGLIDAVPGKVVDSFRSSRTLQRIHDDTVRLFSAHFANTHGNGDIGYELPEWRADIFSLLSYEDCEDIVALRMQQDGYRLLPSTCKRDTAVYEFVMRHKDNGESATAQIKSGSEDLRPDQFAGPGRVYLFTSKGRYIGPVPENVTCLTSDEMGAFMRVFRHLLPERTNSWLQLAEGGELQPSEMPRL